MTWKAAADLHPNKGVTYKVRSRSAFKAKSSSKGSLGVCLFQRWWLALDPNTRSSDAPFPPAPASLLAMDRLPQEAEKTIDDLADRGVDSTGKFARIRPSAARSAVLTTARIARLECPLCRLWFAVNDCSPYIVSLCCLCEAIRF